MSETVSMQIMMRLRQIIRSMSRHSKYIHENYKITVPQLLCLNTIQAQGTMAIGGLTKGIFLNNSTITGIIDRLEKRGLVHRTRISNDRRQVHVEITDAGREFLERAPLPLQDKFIQKLSELSQEELNRIIWSLDMLIEMLEVESGAMVSQGPVDYTNLDGMDPEEE